MTFHESSWLFNKDPYFVVYEIILTSELGRISSPGNTQQKTRGHFFSIARCATNFTVFWWAMKSRKFARYSLCQQKPVNMHTYIIVYVYIGIHVFPTSQKITTETESKSASSFARIPFQPILPDITLPKRKICERALTRTSRDQLANNPGIQLPQIEPSC